MNKRKLITIILSVFLSVSVIASGCGKQEEEVISQSVEEVTPTEEENTEETTDNKEELIEDDSVSENDAIKEEKEEFTLTDMDVQMIAVRPAFTYEQPSSEALQIGAVQQDEVVHVIGQVDNTNWFKISQEGDIQSFIDGTMLTDYTPEEVTAQEEVQQQTEQPAQQQEVQQQQVQDPIMDYDDESIEGNPNYDENGNFAPINPETGQPYQYGEMTSFGGIWLGDGSNNPYW